jgi:flagellin
MGMVVRTNFGAMNATKNMNKNSSKLTSSLEKLSSGFSINKAADDASGLAISEKMKAQIKSLDTASANCEDGVSMIQTTEGYLSEVHDMLNRMVELCEKSANGTCETAESDDGSGTLDADAGVIYNGSHAAGGTDDNTGTAGAVNAGTDRDALQAEMNQLCAEVDRIASTANFNNVKLFSGDLDAKAYNKLQSTDLVANADGTGYTGAGTDAVAADTGTGLTLQIGETSTTGDKLTVNVMRLNTDTLFNDICSYENADGDSDVCLDVNNNNTIKDLSGDVTGYTIDISGQKRASAAGEALRSVINTVSQQRADLGAMQNRLDYTVNNLNTASENITSANSRIRDTDMAKEMTKYTQSNVLTQAAQAMLAQANAQPQQVLQLLQ